MRRSGPSSISFGNSSRRRSRPTSRHCRCIASRDPVHRQVARSGARLSVISVASSQLPSLAWFARIAHHRRFTEAAAEMGVSRAALSQNLKALERQLNVKLLYRTTRDVAHPRRTAAVRVAAAGMSGLTLPG
ncbi:helix-turn-helix domain-containing protein [Paraburkholderia sediminicola]|uniref:helix-turn-helix domain-containing protein n=2 Tax=Paraburkholderia sediminicola TaxID=458836 RepID=UPI0038B7923F